MGCETSALPSDIETKIGEIDDEINNLNKAFQGMQSRARSSLLAKEQRLQKSNEVNEWRVKCEEKLTDLEACVEELNSRMKSRQEHEGNVDFSRNDELEELEGIIANKHKELHEYISQLRFNY